MRKHERRLIRFLSRGGSYPHPAAMLAHRETHISHVFLAGPFAYKLKKPIRFPFLDASTLALRRKWCRLEVALNRRLAPDLYLGVVPVVETGGGLRLGGRGRVVEWLVRMRRLPEERMLDQMVRRRGVSRWDAERVADRLARFFKRAPRGPRIRRWGMPDRLATLVLGNLAECRAFVGRAVSAEDLDFIEEAFRRFLFLHEPLLLRRVRRDRVIDGHGDLRCENICLTDPVTVFDCVEFEPAFRRGDMAGDLAFLLMDLEFRGRPDLARAALARYRRAARDPGADRLLPFYQCHRSLVRGKVRGLAWLQHPGTPRGRRLWRMARRHFALARRYAERIVPPMLVVIGGTIGTGKSTLARSLAGGLGATWLQTDEIRRKEFGRLRRHGQGFAEGLYAPRVSEQVYRRMLRRADDLLRRGRSAVCDGTFSKAAGRRQLREIARRRGALFHFFECTAPRRAAMRRVGARLARRTGLSEARPEFYDRMKAEFDPEHRLPKAEWSRLSTAGSPRATFRAARRILQRAKNPAV